VENIEYVQALLKHPSVDVNLPDTAVSTLQRGSPNHLVFDTSRHDRVLLFSLGKIRV
jgi:hypothetical protein